MGAAALDRTLAILIAAQLLTGLASLRAGAPASAPLFALHGVLAGALLATLALKLRRSVPAAAAAGRWGALVMALLLAAVALAALVGGFAWVVSGRILTIGSWTVLTLHAWAALALVPVAIIHLFPHRWRILRIPRRSAGQPRVSRRTALVTVGLALAGVAAWTAANALEALAGGSRRFTGSRWLPDGGAPPATTFFGEWPEPLAPDSWRLTISGTVERPLSLSAGDLGRLATEEREEVLDCTSGWALRTRWGGVPLAAVLDAARPRPGATRVTVRSTTGWFASLPLDEARGTLLATHVAGEPLDYGNGAPCRLVAPGRRGLEWVKWVTKVELG
jgi:DMSO/TMAO reductase YedYZ molybdopterin-dependent catalytic subunit